MSEEKRYTDKFEEEIFSKEYEQLTREEKEFIADFASNKEEFNAMKSAFFRVTTHLKREEVEGPSGEMKEELMKAFREKSGKPATVKVLGINRQLLQYAAAAVFVGALITSLFVFNFNKGGEVISSDDQVVTEKSKEAVEKELADIEEDTDSGTWRPAPEEKDVLLAETENDMQADSINTGFIKIDVADRDNISGRKDWGNDDELAYNVNVSNMDAGEENMPQKVYYDSVNARNPATAKKEKYMAATSSEKSRLLKNKADQKGKTLADVSYLMSYMQVAY